eukprot:SRR837773.12028.p3 GENE.SRR837773.12028~~SRR837773.12028.p3  ORF type:complete len:112 (-),score=36.34 SRR837773.12028:78-413(-)
MMKDDDGAAPAGVEPLAAGGNQDLLDELLREAARADTPREIGSTELLREAARAGRFEPDLSCLEEGDEEDSEGEAAVLSSSLDLGSTTDSLTLTELAREFMAERTARGALS